MGSTSRDKRINTELVTPHSVGPPLTSIVRTMFGKTQTEVCESSIGFSKKHQTTKRIVISHMHKERSLDHIVKPASIIGKSRLDILSTENPKTGLFS